MVEHVDVLVVGAGISGIGAAHHLQTQQPGRTFAVLERQEGFGGTWRTHTYPGVRSDSDLFTLGYRWKPWTGKPIAQGAQIMDYLREAMDEHDLERHVRYGHHVEQASWDSDTARWTVQGVASGQPFTLTCGFLWMCQGYYDHDRPYTPTWDGMDDFAGRIVHPQRWPDDLDWTGQRIVVIGSGATAATVVPALAETAAHVTMLQRSPTYMVCRPNQNELADQLRALDTPAEWTHEIVRRQTLVNQHAVAEFSRAAPDMVREELLNTVREIMGEDWDPEPHFAPAYRPWQQRLCLIPDGDFFHALKEGRSSVVTEAIDRFVPEGVRLASGEVLEADLVVTATGFDLLVLGGIAFTVDGEPVDPADTVAYRGMMFSGLPNLAWVFGYFRASWTLKVDLLGDFVCRLLAHLDEQGARFVVPALTAEEEAAPRRPWIEPDDFNPGYLARSIDRMPKRLAHEPWNAENDYWADAEVIPAIDLDEPALRYG